MIPSIEECRQLMAIHGMLDNIKSHSIVVARIAEHLATRLSAKEINIPATLTVSAALLHDIGKTICLNSNEDHARKGKEICLQHGYHDIAGIVDEHVILRQAFPDKPLSAKEVVYYADKRVNHDKIVSLPERLDYILDRYGMNQKNLCEKIKVNFERCKLIEQEIFSHLDFTPNELSQRVEKHNGMVYDFFLTANTKR